ncbi:MAG: hypothetical protein AAB840_00860, partial [Patescibacteria group bacterium]
SQPELVEQLRHNLLSSYTDREGGLTGQMYSFEANFSVYPRIEHMVRFLSEYQMVGYPLFEDHPFEIKSADIHKKFPFIPEGEFYTTLRLFFSGGWSNSGLVNAPMDVATPLEILCFLKKRGHLAVLDISSIEILIDTGKTKYIKPRCSFLV